MGATITKWVDTGEKRDERGRRTVPAKERALLIEAYGKSGLTRRAFAEREGIKYFTFIDWLQRARRRGAMAMRPSMVTTPRSQELNSAAMVPAKTAMLEVTWPGGMTVRGENAAAMAELVRALQPAKGPGC
jgi:hypothetical protein